MSYQTFIWYGIGVREEFFEPDIDGIKELLEMAPKTKENFLKGDDDFILEDVIEYYEFFTGIRSCYGLFVDAVKEIENIRFTIADDYNDDHFVMLMEAHPWQMTKEELELTEDSLKEIMKKYLEIYCKDNFREDLFDSEFHYLRVENGA